MSQSQDPPNPEPAEDLDATQPGREDSGPNERLEAIRLEIEALRAMLGLSAPGRQPPDSPNRTQQRGGKENDDTK